MISIAQMKESNLIEYPECINISFPDFKNILDKVMS
jgi:5-enolpyruvylshikimate-3-phosphate synthase